MNATEQIDQMIAAVPDWRGDILKQLRDAINAADPDMQEEWKWSTAVWTNKGLVCAISAFREHVKINFFKGVHLSDSGKILNAGFDSKEHRAIDFHQGDSVNTAGIIGLVRSAVAYNKSK